MSWTSAETLPRGTTLFVRLNRVGTEVREYPVTLVGTQTDGADRVLSLRLTDPKMVVGAGDSGSPVVDKTGQLVGVLFGGFDNDATFFLARAAEDVTNVATVTNANAPDVVAFAAQRNQPMALIASGVPDRLWNVEFGGQKPLTGFRSRATVGAGRVIDELPTKPIAGMSVAVMALSGDAASMYAVGTLSMPTGNGFVAFGHPYMRSGASTLPVCYAATDTMVGTGTGLGVFKWAHPIGQTMGTLTQDSSFGCAVTWGATPTTIPVVVEVTYKGTTKTYRHQAATGLPLDEAFRCFIACIASAEVAVAGQLVTGRAQGWLQINYAQSGAFENRFDVSSDWSIVDTATGALQNMFQAAAEEMTAVRFHLDIGDEIVN